jgi:hypothetical protein
MTFTTITPREASMFAALCDAFVAPAGAMPAVRETDAVFAVNANLAVAPPLNRIGVRAALYAFELAPLLMGYGRRLRRLDADERSEVVGRLGRNAALGPLVEGIRAIAHLCYYGDLEVLRSYGYDPQQVVDRAAALRVGENRW